MAELFLMPQSSPTMESGRLVAWTKAEGDKLAPQDVIAEVEHDRHPVLVNPPSVNQFRFRPVGVFLTQWEIPC